MPATSPNAHLASARVNVPANYAIKEATRPESLGRWALGSMDLRPTEKTGVFRGTSLFDCSESLVEIVPNLEQWLVDYRVGPEGARLPVVSIRVFPAESLGGSGEACLVALLAWRGWQVSDERWARTCTTHETEILLLKAQLEASWKRA